MKKTYFSFASLPLLNLLTLFSAHLHGMENKYNHAIGFFISTTQTSTEIYDFETLEKKSAIYHDFLTTLLSKKSDHLFVPYTLWKKFSKKNLKAKRFFYHNYSITQPASQIKIDETGAFSINEKTNQINVSIENENSSRMRKKFTTVLSFKQDEWTCYDTMLGLVYVKKRGTPRTIINTKTFKHMLAPLYYKLPEANSNNWIDKLNNFIISPQEKPLLVYLTGHANDIDSDYPRIAGIPENKIREIFTYFFSHHPKAIIAIDSCCTPMHRLTRAIELNQCTPCTLATTMRTNVGSFSYEPKIKEYIPSISSSKRKLELIQSTPEEQVGGKFNDFLETIYPILLHEPNEKHQRSIEQALIKHEQLNLQDYQPSLILAGQEKEFPYPKLDQIAKKPKTEP
jgi:hypothetical protein